MLIFQPDRILGFLDGTELGGNGGLLPSEHVYPTKRYFFEET